MRRLIIAIGVMSLLTGPAVILAATINSAVTLKGNVSILGQLFKGSGTFVIDHPLDPKNKLLYHSFVESPDVMNIYDGIVSLDQDGAAVIDLPDYFTALNKDFRYLATPIGGPMPQLHLSQEVRPKFLGIAGNPAFRIAGGVPGGRVSWQITGIRHDPYIEANPIINEVEKSTSTVIQAGECLVASLCR